MGFRNALSGVAQTCALPTSATGLTPTAFLFVHSEGQCATVLLQRYLSASALARSLASEGASLRLMASALRCWAPFCDLRCVQHFSVLRREAAEFAAIFRDTGTYRAYLAHLRSASEFVRLPTGWALLPEVTRAKGGLLKQALVHKKPQVVCFSGRHLPDSLYP